MIISLATFLLVKWLMQYINGWLFFMLPFTMSFGIVGCLFLSPYRYYTTSILHVTLHTNNILIIQPEFQRFVQFYDDIGNPRVSET